MLYLTSEWYILQQLSYCEHFCALLEMNPGSKYLKIKDLEYYVISGNKKKIRIFELQKHTMDVLFLRGLYYLQTFCSQVYSQNAKHLVKLLSSVKKALELEYEFSLMVLSIL